MRVTVTLITIALAVSVSGCAQDLPELRGSISPEAQNAPYPQLVPLDALVARSKAGTTVAAETAGLEGRLARLKRKAAALKGRSVLDGATRLKLLQASRRAAARQTSGQNG